MCWSSKQVELISLFKSAISRSSTSWTWLLSLGCICFSSHDLITKLLIAWKKWNPLVKHYMETNRSKTNVPNHYLIMTYLNWIMDKVSNFFQFGIQLCESFTNFRFFHGHQTLIFLCVLNQLSWIATRLIPEIPLLIQLYR